MKTLNTIESQSVSGGEFTALQAGGMAVGWFLGEITFNLLNTDFSIVKSQKFKPYARLAMSIWSMYAGYKTARHMESSSESKNSA